MDSCYTKVGYVILSQKGGKDENGMSPSEKVTEWYYENIIQEFIQVVREQDPSSGWTRGQKVAEEFRAVTKLDSEKGMMKNKNHKKQRRNYEKKQKNLALF